MRDTKPYPPEEAEPWDVRTRRRRRRHHRPTLASALAAARKAGVAVSGATIAGDGSVALQFGRETPAKNGHIETADELRKLI
jgi:hypothetical protein